MKIKRKWQWWECRKGRHEMERRIVRVELPIVGRVSTFAPVCKHCGKVDLSSDNTQEPLSGDKAGYGDSDGCKEVHQ